MATDLEVRAELVGTVRRFVEREVLPVASDLEHADEYPAAIVDGMRRPRAVRRDDPRGARRARARPPDVLRGDRGARGGWMSLSGVINTHVIAASLIMAQRHRRAAARWLPRLATGELRAACRSRSPTPAATPATSPAGAARDGDEYVITGTKMWVTNGERRRDRRARGPHRRGHHLLHRREGAGRRRFGGITVSQNIGNSVTRASRPSR